MLFCSYRYIFQVAEKKTTTIATVGVASFIGLAAALFSPCPSPCPSVSCVLSQEGEP
jgi:hypothetical protein